MRIVLVSNLYPNPVERCRGMFNYHIANHLAEAGHRVTVVSPLPYFPALRPLKFLDKWYPFSQVPPAAVFGDVTALYPKYPLIPKVSEYAQSFLMLPFLYRALSKIRREEGIDVVNAHYLYPDAVAAARACRVLDLPIVVSALGSDVNLLARNPGLCRQIGRALQQSTAVTAVSEDLAAKMRNLWPQTAVQVLQNGVDLSLFSLQDRKAARALAGMADDAKTILYVGRLSAEKGIPYLVSAARELKAKWPQLRVVLVGSGPEEKALAGMIESAGCGEWIILAGEKCPAEINNLLAVSDLLCIPSIREGCPNVVLEAFAAGRPVVGSQVGGIPELIAPGVNGVMFRPGDVAELAMQLDTVLTRGWDPAAIRGSVAGRSWSAVSGKYVELYQSSIERFRDASSLGTAATGDDQ